jgi:hypothetical protein
MGGQGRHDRAGSCLFAAVEGDPLEDVALLEDIPFVMKGGEVLRPV